MTDQSRHVETQRPATERIEVLSVGCPFPRNARLQTRARHRFDAHEGADQRIAAFRLARRQGEAAITHHDGGDAVFGGR